VDSSLGAGGCSCGATRNWSSAIPNERGTGKPGNVPSAPPKGATFESPRRCVAGKAGRCGKRGDPQPVSKARQAAYKPGQLGVSRAAALKHGDSNRLEDPSPAATEGLSFGVTRNGGRRHGQRMRRRITGCGGRGRARGDSGSASQRLNGTMRGLTNWQDTRRAPGAERSLAFSLPPQRRLIGPLPMFSQR
jgi:hypothetical protein